MEKYFLGFCFFLAILKRTRSLGSDEIGTSKLWVAYDIQRPSASRAGKLDLEMIYRVP